MSDDGYLDRKPHLAPFANPWALDDNGEPWLPEDIEDDEVSRAQDAMFEAGAYADAEATCDR